jgi:hypothetical protein
MIDCQPSLTDEEMGLGGFVNDKRGPLERSGEEYEKERETREKQPKSGDDLKAENELDISQGYNSTYWSHPTEALIYILSIRDIKAGEEIYVNYGHSYWVPFIKRIKESQEQQEVTAASTPEDLKPADLENTKDE